MGLVDIFERSLILGEELSPAELKLMHAPINFFIDAWTSRYGQYEYEEDKSSNLSWFQSGILKKQIYSKGISHFMFTSEVSIEDEGFTISLMPSGVSVTNYPFYTDVRMQPEEALCAISAWLADHTIANRQSIKDILAATQNFMDAQNAHALTVTEQAVSATAPCVGLGH